MKKIINGKKYDTETAKEIGYGEANCPVGDFEYYQEWLYQKKTGEFFLYGEGNAASPYSRACPSDGYCGGSGIVPIAGSEARKWAEHNMSVDDYEKVFGEVAE